MSIYSPPLNERQGTLSLPHFDNHLLNLAFNKDARDQWEAWTPYPQMHSHRHYQRTRNRRNWHNNNHTRRTPP